MTMIMTRCTFAHASHTSGHAPRPSLLLLLLPPPTRLLPPRLWLLVQLTCVNKLPD